MQTTEAPGTLAFREALVSPCQTCDTAPCCRYLPLQTFGLATMTDVDYACYLLNFDNIELGIAADGTWSAYYRQACRFLELDSGGCQLHGTPDKPHICVQYNPYTCWYRPALSGAGKPAEYLRVNRDRMRVILDGMTFDENRALVTVPSWDLLSAEFAGLPMPDFAEVGNEPWSAEPRTSSPGPPTDPCTGCAAYCCTTLMFPLNPPATTSSLDYLRFTLGFPGTEVVVTGPEWFLAVHTRCRHLDGNRCTVFGQPERPLRCQYYDAWTCGYRTAFGNPPGSGTVRLRLEEFPALVSICEFDHTGAATAVPAPEAVLAAIEAYRPGSVPAPQARRLLPIVGVRG